MDRGFTPYFMTFMFKSIKGNQRTKWNRMRREIERVYSTMLTHIIRSPRSTPLHDFPLLIAYPDRPVPKHEKQPLKRITINDGLHPHGMLLDPPWTRMPETIDEHVARYHSLYVWPGHPLLSIHVEPATHNLPRVIDYAMKSFKRGRFDLDDVLVLPKSQTEMPGRPGWHARTLTRQMRGLTERHSEAP
jgi:hypothetical protein